MTTTNTTAEVHSPSHTPRLIHAIILLITSGLTVLVTAILGPNVPNIQAHFEPLIANADYWVPLAVSIPTGVFGICALFIGGLADRIGRKNLLVYATLFYAFVGMAPLVIGDFWVIFGTRIVLGVLEAALMVSSTTMIGDYYAGAKRDKMMSLQTTAASGTATVFVTVGAMVGGLGWNAPFAIYGLAIILFPLMAKYLWEPKPIHASDAEAADAHVQDAPGVTFRPKLLVLTCAVGFLTGVVFMVVPINFGTLFVQAGWAGNIGIGYLINSLALMSATFVFGWLLVGRISVAMQLFIGAVISGLGFYLIGSATAANEMILGGAVNGFGMGLMLPTIVTWNMRELPFAKRGFGTGAFQSCLMIGQAISPLYVVWLGKQSTMAHGVMNIGQTTVLLGLLAFGSHFLFKSKA